jgi:hypothetical protein
MSRQQQQHQEQQLPAELSYALQGEAALANELNQRQLDIARMRQNDILASQGITGPSALDAWITRNTPRMQAEREQAKQQGYIKQLGALLNNTKDKDGNFHTDIAMNNAMQYGNPLALALGSQLMTAKQDGSQNDFVKAILEHKLKLIENEKKAGYDMEVEKMKAQHGEDKLNNKPYMEMKDLNAFIQQYQNSRNSDVTNNAIATQAGQMKTRADQDALVQAIAASQSDPIESAAIDSSIGLGLGGGIGAGINQFLHNKGKFNYKVLTSKKALAAAALGAALGFGYDRLRGPYTNENKFMVNQADLNNSK